MLRENGNNKAPSATSKAPVTAPRKTFIITKDALQAQVT